MDDYTYKLTWLLGSNKQLWQGRSCKYEARSQNRNNKVCAKAPNYMPQSASKVPSELSLTASKLEAKYQKHIKDYQPYTNVV